MLSPSLPDDVWELIIEATRYNRWDWDWDGWNAFMNLLHVDKCFYRVMNVHFVDYITVRKTEYEEKTIMTRLRDIIGVWGQQGWKRWIICLQCDALCRSIDENDTTSLCEDCSGSKKFVDEEEKMMVKRLNHIIREKGEKMWICHECRGLYTNIEQQYILIDTEGHSTTSFCKYCKSIAGFYS